MTSLRTTLMFVAVSVAALGGTGLGDPAHAGQILPAPAIVGTIALDGDISDWAAIKGITVPLIGNGGVSSVSLKAAVDGEMIYLLAVWDDATEDKLFMPFKWDQASKSYRQTRNVEDRFVITLRISGDFSADMVDGSAFEADTWHWMAARSNPAGIAHDKYWRIAPTPFPRAKAIRNMKGQAIFILRESDEGGPLDTPVKYASRKDDVMPSYMLNTNLRGSILDIKAKGVWRDGRWYLEMARKLDTGNRDDTVIPPRGEVEFGVAALNAVTGGSHSYSDKIVLKTGMPPS